MREWVYTEDLFCDDYRAVVLCEYKKELNLLKTFIQISEEAVTCKKNTSWRSFEGVCYSFAESIIDYAKMAYDNILLGHYQAARMIIRAMVENNVFLEVFINDEKQEMWKYYFVQSYRNSLKKFKGYLSRKDKADIEKMYVDYQIDKKFYESKGDKPAYINRPYGWVYSKNEGYKFEDVCKLVNLQDYEDFKMMSDYSHGTAIFQKLEGGMGIDAIMNMLSCLYVGIYRLVTIYCWECAEDGFDEVAERLEDSIRGAIGI